MKKGIDVSSYQGDINWEEAKKYIDFAIIRCGVGNNIKEQDDKKWERNTSECERLSIPYGTYLFSYATNLTMAQSEVEHTLRLVKDKKLEYPIFLDVEERGQLSLPKEQLVEIVKYYCEKIESAGYYVGIYASLSTLNGILNDEALLKYDKWVAEWGKDFSYHKNSGLWQNTDHEQILGINTRVDGDIAFYDYPEIIRKNGLNHLEEQEKETLKYKKGDTAYLNGPLYKEESGTTIQKNYRNKKVTIQETNDKKGVQAPYKTDINGYVKEKDLSDKKVPRACIIMRIIKFILNLFKKEKNI